MLLNTCIVRYARETYLNHKNLYKQLWIGRISNRGIRTCNAHRYTAYHIAQTNRQTTPKQGVACKVVLWRPKTIGTILETS